jgi:hypothetical protein
LPGGREARTQSVESCAEASGFLVVPLVFKTRERRAASLAGSIPVRLRHQRLCRVSGVRGRFSECLSRDVSRPDGNILGTLVRHDVPSTSLATASVAGPATRSSACAPPATTAPARAPARIDPAARLPAPAAHCPHDGLHTVAVPERHPQARATDHRSGTATGEPPRPSDTATTQCGSFGLSHSTSRQPAPQRLRPPRSATAAKTAPGADPHRRTHSSQTPTDAAH